MSDNFRFQIFDMRSLKQSTLNFGQKSNQTSNLNQCVECGMIFCANEKKDTHTHANYHSHNEKILNSTNFPNIEHKIVKEWFDGKIIVFQIGNESNDILKKTNNLLEYIDSQLGISNTPKSKENVRCSKIYLFLSCVSRKIEGACLAEEINCAYPIKYMNEGENLYMCDESRQENVLCGISRIWVSSNMRHNKIATRLLDCVRSNFFYIKSLDINQIAFSAPTHDGIRLAASYSKSKDFFIYDNR
jgi:N-acetyltransferase